MFFSVSSHLLLKSQFWYLVKFKAHFWDRSKFVSVFFGAENGDFSQFRPLLFSVETVFRQTARLTSATGTNARPAVAFVDESSSKLHFLVNVSKRIGCCIEHVGRVSCCTRERQMLIVARSSSENRASAAFADEMQSDVNEVYGSRLCCNEHDASYSALCKFYG